MFNSFLPVLMTHLASMDSLPATKTEKIFIFIYIFKIKAKSAVKLNPVSKSFRISLVQS